jgi:hypothetical protein
VLQSISLITRFYLVCISFLDCTTCITNFLKTKMSAIYQEIKRLIPENFTKIIAHISTDVNLTNQVGDALALYDTVEEKRNYLISFLEGMFSHKSVGSNFLLSYSPIIPNTYLLLLVFASFSSLLLI